MKNLDGRIILGVIGFSITLLYLLLIIGVGIADVLKAQPQPQAEVLVEKPKSMYIRGLTAPDFKPGYVMHCASGPCEGPLGHFIGQFLYLSFCDEYGVCMPLDQEELKYLFATMVRRLDGGEAQ